MTTMHPMETAPRGRGKFVILFIRSGYVTTPLRCLVANYDSEFRPRQPWVDHAGDSVFDGGGNESDLVGWAPIPTHAARAADMDFAFGGFRSKPPEEFDTRTELGEAKVAPDPINI